MYNHFYVYTKYITIYENIFCSDNIGCFVFLSYPNALYTRKSIFIKVIVENDFAMKCVIIYLLLYHDLFVGIIEEPLTNVLENKVQSLLKNYTSRGYELQMGRKYETRNILENKGVEATPARYHTDDGDIIIGLETEGEVTECPRSEKCCKVYTYDKTSKVS